MAVFSTKKSHADAISFFLRHGGVLKISRGVEHDQEAEPHAESSKNFDLKSRFSFGLLKKSGSWNISKRKSTF